MIDHSTRAVYETPRLEVQPTRAKYEAPKLEVVRLGKLPSALAASGCRITASKASLSCSVSGTGGRTGA